MAIDPKIIELVEAWLAKADRSLSAARFLLELGNTEDTVSRIYYAAFYTVRAVMVYDGISSSVFKSHQAVRKTLHKEYVRTGKVEQSLAKLYDRLLNEREASDYSLNSQFDVAQVEKHIIDTMKLLAWARLYTGNSKK